MIYTTKRFSTTGSFNYNMPDIARVSGITLEKHEPLMIARAVGKIIPRLGRKQDNNVFYNLYYNSEKIGCLNLTKLNQETVDLGIIEIKEKYRNSDFPQKIITFIIGFLKKQGISRITLQSFDYEVSMYKKIGFVVTNPRDSYGLTEMELKL